MRLGGRNDLPRRENFVLLGKSRAQSGQMRQRIGRGTVPAQLVAQVLRYHFYTFTKIPFALHQELWLGDDVRRGLGRPGGH